MSRHVFPLPAARRCAAAAFLLAASAGCAMKRSQMGLGNPRQEPPLAPIGVAQPPTTTASRGNVVIVQEGETISDLSQRHKVPITVLMSENRLKDPNIFPGMVLLIPRR